jgi:hypothetical protein
LKSGGVQKRMVDVEGRTANRRSAGADIGVLSFPQSHSTLCAGDQHAAPLDPRVPPPGGWTRVCAEQTREDGFSIFHFFSKGKPEGTTPFLPHMHIGNS